MDKKVHFDKANGLGRFPAGPQGGRDKPEGEPHRKQKRQGGAPRTGREGRFRVRRGGGRTLHYGAGSGVVGPHEADSEGEAKKHKRQARGRWPQRLLHTKGYRDQWFRASPRLSPFGHLVASATVWASGRSK